MPLTAFQKAILAVLAASRSPESHFAGGVLLHASDDSARFSRDFDIFHDVAAEVSRASERDVAALRAAGFTVEPRSHGGAWDREATFRRARVRDVSGGQVEIDWAAESAFRFFPIEPDPDLGWRLHLFDAATNKALTLAARTETRDYVDIVEIGQWFRLSAVCWAACGKDPGFTPLSLLAMMRRFARVDPVELDKIRARTIDPVALKARWVTLSDEAQAQMTAARRGRGPCADDPRVIAPHRAGPRRRHRCARSARRGRRTGRHAPDDPQRRHPDRRLVSRSRVKYLLDTQAWMWSVLDHPRLSRRARTALNAVPEEERIGIAAISLKERRGIRTSRSNPSSSERRSHQTRLIA